MKKKNEIQISFKLKVSETTDNFCCPGCSERTQQGRSCEYSMQKVKYIYVYMIFIVVGLSYMIVYSISAVHLLLL